MNNAFPENDIYDERLVGKKPGLTKREYFAIRVLEGLLANPSLENSMSAEVLLAVEYADLLIAELNKD